MQTSETPSFYSLQPQTAANVQKKVDIREAYDSLGTHLQYSIPAMAVGALHDLGNGTFWDIEPEDVQQQFADMGMENFGSFYARHHEGYRLAGTLVTSLIPITLATKAIRAGNMLDKALRKLGPTGEMAQKLLISSGKTMKERAALVQKSHFANFVNEKARHTAFLDDVIKSQKLQAGTDMLKESLAAEVALYGLYYDEKTAAEGTNPFYTDSLTQNIAFAVLPTALLSAGSYAFTGRHINNWIAQEGSKDIAKALNETGVDLATAASRTGHRGVAIAAWAQDVQQNVSWLNEMKTPTGATEVSRNIKTGEGEMHKQLDAVMTDKVFGNFITPPIKPETMVKESQHVIDAFKNEPSLSVGLVGFTPFTREFATLIPKAREAEIANLRTKIKTINDNLTKLELAPIPDEMAIAKAQLQRDALNTELDGHLNSTRVIMFPDQSIAKFEDYKWSSIDDFKNFSVVTDEAGWVMLPQQRANQLGVEMKVSPSGSLHFVTPQGKLQELEKTRFAFKVLDDAAIKAEPGHASMQDMAETWNFRTEFVHTQKGEQVATPSLGKRVFSQMPETHRVALERWKGTPAASGLRTNPKMVNEIQEHFRAAGFHARLADFADSDGFLTLYRGESIEETMSPKNALVSMSTAPQIAKSFAGGEGKHVLAVRVHVDDIVAPAEFWPRGGEFEFLVKNADKRIDVQAEMAKRLSLGELSHEQMMEAWALMQARIGMHVADVETPIVLKANASFYDYDYALEAIAKDVANGQVPQVKMSLGFGTPARSVTTAEDIAKLEFESINAKFDMYQQLVMGRLAHEQKMANATFKPPAITDEQIAQILNIPSSYGFEKHPLLQIFDAMLPSLGEHKRSLRSFFNSMEDLNKAMSEFVSPGTLNESRQNITGFKMRGNSLRHDKDVTVKPVILHYSQERLGKRAQNDELNTLIAIAKLQIIDGLQNQNKAPLVKAISEAFTNNPDQYLAMTRPDLLVEGTQTGGKYLATHGRANTGIPTLEAMDLAGSVNNRQFQKQVAQRFEPHTPIFGKLASSNNRGSLIALTHAINALRKGWDIAEELVEGQVIKLTLDHKSPRNQKLWMDTFGEKLEEGAVMSLRDGDGKAVPVSMDQLAYQGLKSIEELSHGYLAEINQIRRTKGYKEITKRAFHVPFFDMTSTSQAFILDEAGQIERAVFGPTAKEALSLAQQDITEMSKKGFRGSVATAEQLREDFRRSYIAWEAPKNYGMSSKQTGGIKGKAQTEIVDVDKDVVKNIVHQLQNNYESLYAYTAHTMFESELEFAMRAKNAASISDKAKRTNATIWDTYSRSVLQKSALNGESTLGTLYGGIEQAGDKALATLWDTYGKFVPTGAKVKEKDYEAYVRAAGGKVPYTGLHDMIARTRKAKVPPKTKEVLEKFNRFATNAVLRVADFGMPVVNFASLLTTVPAVAKAWQRMPDESLEVYQARLGAYGVRINDDFSMPNPLRLAYTAMHDFWQPEMRETMRRAAKLGFFDQEAAERITFMTEPFETAMQQRVRKGIDMLSIPTDWSERMSRALSFTMAYGVGKRTLGLADEAAMAFAHKQANNVVGDYRIINKPQIFQGAPGMPMGLFTTWAWNYLQRVYGDLEGGRIGAVAMQGILQQLFFGAESMPGAETMIDLLTGSYDGKTNIVDKLDRSFGPIASDIIMSGSLASLSGIAVQARADITMPSVFTNAPWTQKMPALGVATDMAMGMKEAVESLVNNQGFNRNELAEIIALHSPNGFVRTMAELGMGYSVDHNRNLITEDTRTFQNIAARAVELRTQVERRKVQELRKDAIATAMYKERLATLEDQLISRIRANDLSGEDMERILQQYYKIGGTDIKGLIRRAAIKATVEKPYQKLIEMIKANDEEAGTARLLRLYEE